MRPFRHLWLFSCGHLQVVGYSETSRFYETKILCGRCKGLDGAMKETGLAKEWESQRDA